MPSKMITFAPYSVFCKGMVQPVARGACRAPRRARTAPAREAYPVLLPAVGGEVVDGHLDTLALFQLLEGGHDEVKVKGVWMVEVEVVVGGLFLLLCGQHLRQEGSGGSVGLSTPRGRPGRGLQALRGRGLHSQAQAQLLTL